MKFTIISLLLPPIFLLTAGGFAQQSSDNSVAGQGSTQTQPAATNQSGGSSMVEVAKLQREKLCKAGNVQFCDKDQKPDPDATAKGSLGPKEGSMPESQKLDKSWMEPALTYQQHETHSIAPGSSKELPAQLSDSDLESLIDRLADKSARELGDDAVRDIQFPGRPQWEQQLYEQKEKLVAAGRATMPVLKSTSANKDMILGALSNFKTENFVFNRIKAEGIAQADDWERRR